MVCRTLSHKDPKHCSAMAKRFLLSDSTAYGWLPSRAVSGNGVEVVQETIAFISCGGSLIRKGTSGPSILTLLSNWIKENPDFLHQDAAVCCKAVPARDSVPQRSYDALERGRDQWQVPETKTPIMHIAPEAYKGRTWHFKAAVASTAMQTVVQVALQDFPAERFPVLVCAGWNVSEKEHIDEMLALRHLCDAQDWKSFKVAVFQHSSEKVDFAVYCHCLRQPPPLLFQTNTEDHDQAAENKSRFAPHLTREFVPDNGCATDIFSLGGQDLLDRYNTFQRGAHKADFWRYVRLGRRGGNYLDIKMALLRPLQETLSDIYRQGDATETGQSIAQAFGVQSIAQTPHLILAIGQKKDHIFQGCILDCSPMHPLMTAAIRHCCNTRQTQLSKCYMLFCRHLWNLIKNDLNGNEPQHGWNWTPTYGPIFLFLEMLLKTEGATQKQMVDAQGIAVPMDGHVMSLPHDLPHFACTRAWGWKHGFKTHLEALLACTAQEKSSGSTLAPAETAASSSSDTRDSAPPAFMELTSESIEKIHDLARTPWYADLDPSELRRFIPLGLRIATDGSNYLVCKFCKNHKRKQLHFQGPPEVRSHFDKHRDEPEESMETHEKKAAITEAKEETTEDNKKYEKEAAEETKGVWADAGPVPTWATADAESRLAAAAQPVGSTPLAALLLASLLNTNSDMARFIDRVTDLIESCLQHQRQEMATILTDLHDVPVMLGKLWQAKNQKATTWNHITHPWFVNWHVRDTNWPLSMPSEKGVAEVKGTIYSTVAINLLLEGLTQSIDVAGLAGEDRTRALRSCCAHFNVACSSRGHVCRLLLSNNPERFKFDLNPADIERLYGGTSSKKTKTQRTTGIAHGRQARAPMQIND